MLLGVITAPFVIGILGIFAGIMAIRGYPMVVIKTEKGDINSVNGTPWEFSDAKEFANALRNQILKE